MRLSKKTFAPASRESLEDNLQDIPDPAVFCCRHDIVNTSENLEYLRPLPIVFVAVKEVSSEYQDYVCGTSPSAF